MKNLQVQHFIVDWIKEYANKYFKKSLIIGISGGIDSALTSTLCAMTGLTTIVLSMPIYQKKNELDNAEKHIKWLCSQYNNVQFMNIDLSDFFDQFKNSIPKSHHSELGLANSKARIRMLTLYQIATQENGIVVGTGNKIEDFGIGFFTKYGDGGVDISPIADLNKSEVKNLAQALNIITDIITAPPTDGLWSDGRTDEKQIGATYKELEWAMEFNSNRDLNSREKKVMQIYHELNQKNQHKMKPIPICKIPKNMKQLPSNYL